MAGPILTSIISNPLAWIAAASPFIINYIQSQSARLAAESQHRTSEIAQANEIGGGLSDNMDQLVYFSTETAFGLVLRGGKTLEDRLPLAVDQEAWKNYQTQANKWKGSRTRYRANVSSYFGQKAFEVFKNIQKLFDQLDAMVDATYFLRKDSEYYLASETDLHDKYFSVRDKLLVEVEDLNNQMVKAIMTEDVGSLRDPSSYTVRGIG